MKVKHLINILSKIDSEIEVGVLQNSGIYLARNVGLYEGEINVSNDKETIWNVRNHKYVIIGNPGGRGTGRYPGDFDKPASLENNKPVETYYVNDAGNIVLYK